MEAMTSEKTSEQKPSLPIPAVKSPGQIWWDNFQILFIALILGC